MKQLIRTATLFAEQHPLGEFGTVFRQCGIFRRDAGVATIMLTIVTNTNTNTNTNTIVVTTTIASRRKILSELGDQTRMGLFVDLHENREHNQAKHNAHQRNHEGEGLEDGDVLGRHVGGGGGTDHAGGHGHEADEAVGECAGDLVGRTDSVTASLRLPVFSWPYSMESSRHTITVI